MIKKNPKATINFIQKVQKSDPDMSTIIQRKIFIDESKQTNCILRIDLNDDLIFLKLFSVCSFLLLFSSNARQKTVHFLSFIPIPSSYVCFPTQTHRHRSLGN